MSNAPAPAALDYAMPAEWAPHQATWLSWPHKRESWPGKFEAVEPVMVRFVAALAADELVRINVLDETHERHVAGLLDGHVNAANVRFHRFRTNDAWCRDHGAIFVTRSGKGARRGWRSTFVSMPGAASIRPSISTMHRPRRWHRRSACRSGRSTWSSKAARSTSTAPARC